MKILHVINTLSAGGAELHLLTLCRYQKRQGIDLAVACFREKVTGSRSLRSDFEKEGIEVVNLQSDGRWDLRFIARLIRLLKLERPDILHTHLPRADFAGAFARLFCSDIVWVCSLHNIYNSSWSGRWTLPLLNYIWRRPDRVVAISYAVRDWLVNNGRIPIDKISVIHYGIEHQRFSRTTNALDNGCALPGREIVGSIGRLEPRKGHDSLIKAMAIVCKELPHASLLIAGHDPWAYGPTLQALINQSGLHGRVRLVGFHNDVASFLADINVFAFASRSEGFGQVLIEAMAAGKPVVASRIPPLTEIVTEDETGLLADPDDPQAFANAILWLLTHPEQANQIGKRGQERVYDYFSAPRMGDEISSIYHQLIGEHHVPRTLA